MKASIQHNGHTISIETSLLGKVIFKIDGVIQNASSGFLTNNLLTNNLISSKYEGEIVEGNDKGDKVRVERQVGFLKDNFVFFYNGEEIDNYVYTMI